MNAETKKYKYFSPQTIADVTGGDDEIEKDLIIDFLEWSPKYFNELENKIKALDMEQIKFFAHKLRGSLRYIGATTLNEYAEQIEHCKPSDTQIQEIQTLFLELKTYYPIVLEELKDYAGIK